MIPSFNIGYILVRIFEIIAGTNVQVSGNVVYDQLLFTLESIGVFGMTLAVVLLVLIVYVRIRLVQVEHSGYQMLEAREHTHKAQLAQEPRNAQWEMVQSLIASPSDSDWRRAIMEADIMLDRLLTERGYQGETLGEKLKNANPLQFTTLDAAWEAHRTRNAVAHLGEAFPLSERDARSAIDQYRRVFEEFGYI